MADSEFDNDDVQDSRRVAAAKANLNPKLQTVKDPQRMAFPGIYGNPKEIAAKAASRVAPEDPALKQLFGVTRADLYEMNQGRKGNLPGTLPGAAAKPKGAAAAARVMTKENEQRLVDTLGEAQKHESLRHGMEPWYITDPAFQRMVQLIGMEAAVREYDKLNHLMGMASPASEVMTEIPRGTAAYSLNTQGRFGDFLKYAGMPEGKRTRRFPADIRNVPGHAYHRTAQAGPMAKYLESGEMTMKTPKVPLYIQASGVPETGFQTATPVGDAHWSRAVGLADTRNWKNVKGKQAIPGASVTNPEMAMLSPWWRSQIADKVGLEPVSAQGLTWGTYAPQTGVDTPIGAGKLELLAKNIMMTARRLGVSPETARDMILMGKTYAGKAEGGSVGYAEGGEVKADEPSQDEMLAHVMLKNMSSLKDVGANEAPNMRIKAYVPPAGGPGLPIGGVDFQPEAQGQQMLPGQPAPPPGAPGQPPQAGAPQGGAPGQPPAAPQGQPPNAPRSNILQMTPQGQAMAAMRASPPPGMPMPKMAGGGTVSTPISQMREELRRQSSEPFDPIGNIKRDVTGAWGTIKAIPGNLQRLARDPAQYVKDLPPLSGEQVMGAFSPSNIGFAGMMIGPKAQTFNMGKAAQAEKMRDAGHTPQEIWKETGTLFGKDGIPRQEISDQNAVFRKPDDIKTLAENQKANIAQTQQQLLPDRSGQKDFWPKALTEAKKPVRETVRMLKQELGDMSYDPTGWRGVPSRYTLDHPELYAAYPELASVPIKQRYQKGAEKGSMSMQGGKLSDIEVNDASNPRSVALHEMQHAVQAIEGMSPGASPLQAYATPEWKRMYTENLARHLANEPAGTVPSRALEDKIANEAAFRWYQRQQGEAEARATQARRDMGNTERAQSYPYNSYDVPENQLLTKAPLPYVGKAAGGTVKDYIRITERKL